MSWLLLHTCVLLCLLHTVRTQQNNCYKKIPQICPQCCAILYDNMECDTKSWMPVKRDARGVLGAIWENAVRTVEIYKDCLLTLYEERNQTGTSRALGLDGHDVVYQLEHYAFDRRASSLTCRCNKGFPAPTTETHLYITDKASANHHHRPYPVNLHRTGMDADTPPPHYQYTTPYPYQPVYGTNIPYQESTPYPYQQYQYPHQQPTRPPVTETPRELPQDREQTTDEEQPQPVEEEQTTIAPIPSPVYGNEVIIPRDHVIDGTVPTKAPEEVPQEVPEEASEVPEEVTQAPVAEETVSGESAETAADTGEPQMQEVPTEMPVVTQQVEEEVAAGVVAPDQSPEPEPTEAQKPYVLPTEEEPLEETTHQVEEPAAQREVEGEQMHELPTEEEHRAREQTVDNALEEDPIIHVIAPDPTPQALRVFFSPTQPGVPLPTDGDEDYLSQRPVEDNRP